MVNILEEVGKDLAEIKSYGQEFSHMIPFSLSRKFAVDVLMLEKAEIILYQAFNAPIDDIFYFP